MDFHSGKINEQDPDHEEEKSFSMPAHDEIFHNQIPTDRRPGQKDKKRIKRNRT